MSGATCGTLRSSAAHTLGPGRKCSKHHRLVFNSRNEGLEWVEGYFEHFLPSPAMATRVSEVSAGQRTVRRSPHEICTPGTARWPTLRVSSTGCVTSRQSLTLVHFSAAQPERFSRHALGGFSDKTGQNGDKTVTKRDKTVTNDSN